jgi:hypothetical protein
VKALLKLKYFPIIMSQRMNCETSKSAFLSISGSLRFVLAWMISALAASAHGQNLLLKTETFDADPGWDGRYNRATDPGAKQIRQNFGFSAATFFGWISGRFLLPPFRRPLCSARPLPAASCGFTTMVLRANEFPV